MTRTPCLVLSNGVVGAEKQALALANALSLPFSVTRVRNGLCALPTGVQLAALRLDSRLLGVKVPQPPPIVAISCGRACVPSAVSLRRDGHTFAVHIQRPPCDPSLFDLVIAPKHDYPSDRPLPPNGEPHA